MNKNREEYKTKYATEIKWFKDNFNIVKSNSFMMDMYEILLTGKRKMTDKMIASVRKNINSPKYDEVAMIKRKEKMRPILEKINRVWELVAEVDGDKADYYLSNYSALPFVNSLKEQFEKNYMLSEKQMKALNSVYKKYKKRLENKKDKK
jgi:hypothetical protein